MRDAHQRGIQDGMDVVVSSSGEVVGTVDDVRVSERGTGPETGIIMVRPAREDDERWEIPFSSIARVEEHRVVLDLDPQRLSSFRSSGRAGGAG